MSSSFTDHSFSNYLKVQWCWNFFYSSFTASTAYLNHDIVIIGSTSLVLTYSFFSPTPPAEQRLERKGFHRNTRGEKLEREISREYICSSTHRKQCQTGSLGLVSVGMLHKQFTVLSWNLFLSNLSALWSGLGENKKQTFSVGKLTFAWPFPAASVVALFSIRRRANSYSHEISFCPVFLSLVII